MNPYSFLLNLLVVKMKPSIRWALVAVCAICELKGWPNNSNPIFAQLLLLVLHISFLPKQYSSFFLESVIEKHLIMIMVIIVVILINTIIVSNLLIRSSNLPTVYWEVDRECKKV